MNHRNAFRKLGRTPAHRRALLRNLATSLILKERIETTLPKAKELKRVADKLVTLGKKGTLHARRQALGYLMPINRREEGNAGKRTAVHKLFEELAPRYSERPGGYTRVVRGRTQPSGKRIDARRPGDNAQMAIVEFVEAEMRAKPTKRRRRATRRDAEPVTEAETATKEATADEAPAAEAPREDA